MGIVEKQAIKGTVYTYLGVIIGFITNGIIFPRILKSEEIGLLSILVSYSLIFAQLSSLGFISTTTRMFTFFRDQNKQHHGFLFLALLVTTIGFVLSLIIFFIVKPILVEKSLEKSYLFSEYINYLIPLIAFILYFNILDNYYKVLYNAVIGTFLKELFQRFLILIGIILFYFSIVDFNQFVIVYIICFALPTLIIILSLIKAGQFNLKPQFKFLTKDLSRTMTLMSLFGIISASTGVITLNIDRILIDDILGLGPTGVYVTAFFFATLVILPSRPLLKISSAVIADAWRKNDTVKLNDLYYKSCLNQMIIGLLLLIGLWVNIDNIFKILPPVYESGRYVILYIGISFLFDMVIGVNTTLVANSRYYKVGALYMIVWVLLVIITNLILIPIYGIVGSAIASALSKLIVDSLAVLFVYVKFKMFPYNYKFLVILLIGGLAYFIGYLIPEMHHFILDIIIRSSLVAVIYIMLILGLRLSEEMNQNFHKTIKILKGTFKKN
ncbi:MAG: polysaccharide biosynthesis protein [Bacteroidetes bacterium]|nr:polysaccharide biosynthesis protein [Bacteroidota bacterium]